MLPSALVESLLAASALFAVGTGSGQLIVFLRFTIVSGDVPWRL